MSDTGGAGGTVVGGAAGVAGVAGGVRGGAGGAAGNGALGGSSGDAATEVVWPNAMRQANSDAWLSENHDRITQLRPRVLVIDLENTADAQAQVDKHIAALKHASSPHQFKDPSARATVAYELVKIAHATKGSGSSVDYSRRVLADDEQGLAIGGLEFSDCTRQSRTGTATATDIGAAPALRAAGGTRGHGPRPREARAGTRGAARACGAVARARYRLRAG